jgi:hypothetical protein
MEFPQSIPSWFPDESMDESPRELAGAKPKPTIVSPGSGPAAIPAAVSAPAEPIPANRSARGATTAAGTTTGAWETTTKAESEKRKEHCQ